MRRVTPGTRDSGRGTRGETDAIGIVGLGLIGGSLAKAIAARFPKRVLIGVEPSARCRRLAGRDGIFESLLPRPSAELARCQIVVLCAPVPAILRLLGPVSRRMREGALLTDVGGIKGPIVVAAGRDVRPKVSFVGAHPIFGGETGGYAAAQRDLWRGKVVAVCTDRAPKGAVDMAAWLHRAVGARVVLCRAADHDAAVAAVSHLPYVTASALALTAQRAGPLALRLAGKGFADATRPGAFLWRIQGESAKANPRLASAAASFERQLHRLLRALRGPQGQKTFAKARRARQLGLDQSRLREGQQSVRTATPAPQ